MVQPCVSLALCFAEARTNSAYGFVWYDTFREDVNDGGCMDLTTLPGYVAGFPDELGLRELGGLMSVDGRTVRHGLLYRGSALTGLTEEQRARIDALDLRFILDLRALGETEGKPDYVPDGCEYVRIGGMAEEDGTEIDFSPAGIGRLQAKFAEYGPALMNELYASMAFDNRAVHLLMERFVAGQAPLYFHCSAGKDRTGVCAAMLLMALGVPDEVIIQEYLLTNEYRARIINLPLDQIPDSVGENERANWAQVNSVSADALRAVLDAIDARHPTREAYFAEEFGMDAETLASLRDRYLE